MEFANDVSAGAGPGTLRPPVPGLLSAGMEMAEFATASTATSAPTSTAACTTVASEAALPLIPPQLPDRVTWQLNLAAASGGSKRHGTCLAFHPEATYLAIGCSDDAVLILDFVARSVAAVILRQTSSAIADVGWLADGKTLMVASTDWNVEFWDVASVALKWSMRCSSHVHSVALHPTLSNLLVVVPAASPPTLVDTQSGRLTPLPISVLYSPDSIFSSAIPRVTSAAGFVCGGKKILVGFTTGEVQIVSLDLKTGADGLSYTLKLEHSLSLSPPAIVRGFRTDLSRPESPIYVLSTSNTVHVLHPETFATTGSVAFPTAPRCVALSRHLETLAAACSSGFEHNLHVRSLGAQRSFDDLELRCVSYAPLALEWHPIRTTLALVGSAGSLLVYDQPVPETWHRLVTGIQEVTSNVIPPEAAFRCGFSLDAAAMKRHGISIGARSRSWAALPADASSYTPALPATTQTRLDPAEECRVVVDVDGPVEHSEVVGVAGPKSTDSCEGHELGEGASCGAGGGTVDGVGKVARAGVEVHGRGVGRSFRSSLFIPVDPCGNIPVGTPHGAESRLLQASLASGAEGSRPFNSPLPFPPTPHVATSMQHTAGLGLAGVLGGTHIGSADVLPE